MGLDAPVLQLDRYVRVLVAAKVPGDVSKGGFVVDVHTISLRFDVHGHAMRVHDDGVDILVSGESKGWQTEKGNEAFVELLEPLTLA